MKVLSSSCLAVLLSMLAVAPCVADETWWVSAYTAATMSDSYLTGSDSQTMRLDDGTAVQAGLALARDARFFDHGYRIAAQVGNVSWASADGAQVVFGVDYLWDQHARSGGGVYLGPRLGLMEFDEDITDQSDTTAVYGYEFGFWQPFNEGEMTLGFFFQQLFVDVDNQTPAATGMDLGVSVDRLDSLGVRLSWRL